MSNLNTQIHWRSSRSLIGENVLVEGFDSHTHTHKRSHTHTHTLWNHCLFFILSQQIIRGDITTSITPATTQPSPHSLQLQLPKNHCFHGNWASLTQGPRCGLHEQHADENLPKAAASHSVLPELSQSRAGLLRQCMRPARYNVLYMEFTTCARQSFDILSVVADIYMMACYNQAAQRWWISSESQTGRLVNFTQKLLSGCWFWFLVLSEEFQQLLDELPWNSVQHQGMYPTHIKDPLTCLHETDTHDLQSIILTTAILT